MSFRLPRASSARSARGPADAACGGVTVRIGALTAVVPDAMRFCFDLAVEGILADGAELAIDHRPGAAHCRTCGLDVRLDDPILLSPCGSADLEVTGGRELQIVSMEVG